MNVLVIGGSGGIGGALVKAFCERDSITSVTATWYSKQPMLTHAKLRWLPLDVNDEAAIKGLCAGLPQLDYLINAVGLLHSSQSQPEKTITRVDPQWFMRSMQVNALPLATACQICQTAAEIQR